jgi:hypothetical protein
MYIYVSMCLFLSANVLQEACFCVHRTIQIEYVQKRTSILPVFFRIFPDGFLQASMELFDFIVY